MIDTNLPSDTFDLTNLPNALNPIYEPLLYNKDRYMVLYGGAGSGKSHFIVQKYLIRIMVGAKTGVKHKILAIRKTQPAVRKSVFALFLYYIDSWNLYRICKINHTEMTIKFRDGSMILCSGLDDPNKIKSIEGITSIWMEEATEFTWSDFLQIDLRLRGRYKTYLQICISFNPIECKWLIDEFFPEEIDDKSQTQVKDITEDPDCRLRKIQKQVKAEGKEYTVYATRLMTVHKDNRFLDDIQRAIIEGLQDKDFTWYEIYGRGNWGSPRGQVYIEGFNWDVVNHWPDPKQFHRKHGYGLDFGYSNAPTGIIEVGIIDNHIYEREILYSPKLTNPDICEKLRSAGLSKYDIICADSAEPKSIEEIKKDGWYIVPCIKGRDSVNFGIDLVKTFKTHIYSDSDNLIKEKRNYKWREDNNGNALNIPVDEWNHLLDAERYIVTFLVGGIKSNFIANLGKRY